MAGWWRRELSLGSEGPDVEVVQRKLRCWASGLYDVETAARVKALQKRLGRPVTGIVDRGTAEALGELPTALLEPSWYHRELRLGDQGEDVAELRRMLGLEPGDRLDEEADAAVRRFQSGRHHRPTGIVDRDTAVALGDDVPLRR